MTTKLLLLVLHFSSVYNLPPALILAIAKVESNFKANAVSPDGQDLGLMQIRHTYYPEFTKQELLDPETNLGVGAAYLSEAKDRCKHKLDLSYVICFNLGISGGSKIKFPKQFKYYKAVMAEYRKLKGLFKAGDRVKIKDCYGTWTKAEGYGTVLGPSKERFYEDCYIIELDNPKEMKIKIAEDRLSKE